MIIKSIGVVLGFVLLSGAAFNAFHGSQGSGGTTACTVNAQLQCISVDGNQVAAEATLIARSLTLCGPYNQDTCYDNLMPPTVLAYWSTVCPHGSGCFVDWQSGNVQCVLLVVGAYGLAGDPVPVTGNAIDFWPEYANRAGWQEIANGAGVPVPGDMVVYDTPTATPDNGHIAIVVQVTGNQVEIAEANGPGEFVLGRLDSTNHLSFGNQMSGVPLGYIRHIGIPTLPKAFGEPTFVCAALPFAQLAQSDITAGPQAQPHPWYVSVILAQWGVEQGWQMPSQLDGYNFGNVSAIPGQPSVGGTGQPGAPAAFAEAPTPQQGVADYVRFVQNGQYNAVAAAYGAMARRPRPLRWATSPWDAGHYAEGGGGPGASLSAAITTYHLTQYDQPGAHCVA